MEEMVTVYSIDPMEFRWFISAQEQSAAQRAVPNTEDVKELAFDFQGASNLPSPETAINITC